MSRSLLTYSRALKKIFDFSRPNGRTTTVPLADARGFALAEDLIASEANPRFDNSAVDGFAVSSETDALSGTKLRIQSAIAAGSATIYGIDSGCSVRILTGAPTPEGTFGIAMQEDVVRDGDWITLRQTIRPGEHIRRRGADFPEKSMLASSGTVIDPGVAAQLAFLGITKPSVFESPRVSIITTGDELVDPSAEPTGSQVRDTNSIMLRIQVEETCRTVPTQLRVADSREDLRSQMLSQASKNEVIIVSGGASVGDRDFVHDTVSDLGEIYFHGVAIRPGKPILFGRILDCVVFGLPGNPASSFVCYELFVREALRRIAGWNDPGVRWFSGISGFNHAPCGREDFVRVRLNNGKLVPAGEQGSHGIGSLANADGLARYSADKTVAMGDECLVTWLK